MNKTSTIPNLCDEEQMNADLIPDRTQPFDASIVRKPNVTFDYKAAFAKGEFPENYKDY